ncbi:MAG: Uma2 family endonuclease [Plectolyngbya sp. WJT66-NPBG17]|nr:Uma2 family endonuclease [Plectolyngbya sp. WJT66-NPBG17]MBW4524857.1 Uma2 family endonuclease [Phormidium tanganyikae FI6-MK23]
MIQLGILTDDDPVELLEGWLVYKMPKNPPHRIATKLTRDALDQILPSGWYVDTQEPITLIDSEPEPDIVIVRGATQDYVDRHPTAQDIALVIEVADSTLERDRTSKKRLYARAGIPIYWIINLVDRSIEVYAQPENEDYQQQTTVTEQIEVVLEGTAIAQISTSNLLPYRSS